MGTTEPYGYGYTTATNCGCEYGISTESGLYSVNQCYRVPSTPVETKEAKVIRIAREKMYASWKLYNQKTEKITKIIQVCKPRHRLSFMGRRHLN